MRAIIRASALMAATLFGLSITAKAVEVSPPDEKSGVTRSPQGISAYDYTVSSGARQVRLKMETSSQEKVYSSFVDGVLVANARVPVTPVLTDPDTTTFNQYIKASSDAIMRAGVDPKALGLTYIAAQSVVSADAKRAGAPVPSDLKSRIVVTPGLTR